VAIAMAMAMPTRAGKIDGNINAEKRSTHLAETFAQRRTNNS
jgi:hypothetical protein